MRSPRSLALLFAALLVPLAVVGGVGLSALASDVERARARYAEQAGTLARSVVDLLEGERRELLRNDAALRWRAAGDSDLLEPAARSTPGEEGPDRSVRESASVELDALELRGETERAEARLRELAAREERPALAAWAWSWLAARAQRAGNTDEARAAWRKVCESFPDARDDRGLRRAFAARSELALLDGDPLELLLALHGDVVADRTSTFDTATAALALRIAERIAAQAPERADGLLRASVEAARPLRLRAAWSQGISDWIARGASGGVRVFDLTADPALGPEQSSRVLVAATREGEGWSGVALELERLAARALERADPAAWRELGFAVAIEDGSGRVLAGVAPASGAPTAVERAREPLHELLVRAHGSGFEAFVAGERRRFQLVAALCAAAFLAAVAAAFATVRAVGREARTAREREQFVAAVTHELKTPLASIRLLAELLESGDVDPVKVREFGARTVRESDRLSRLVDSVLRFSRLERGLKPEELARIDLAELAGAAIASVAPLADERGFEVRLEALGSPTVRGDRDALLGALAELVDNATKYGDPAAGVDVRVERDGDRARVSVLDRGRGVPQAERERIFEPFHRIGDELTRERPGVGLGLALVRGVTLAHGGQSGCAPRDGGGSCFWIELAAETV